MNIACPQCAKKYSLDETSLAKGPLRVKCPSCNHVWAVGKKSPAPQVGAKEGEAKTSMVHDGEAKYSATPRLLPIEDFTILRTLVGFLGEKPQYGWWDTDFLSKTSLQFLEINFPRSYVSAGCVSVCQAALRVHDQFIGKNGCLHLFRLTQSEEQALHNYLLTADPADIISSIQDRESALSRLKSFFNKPVGAPAGPIQVGTINTMFTRSGFEEMAKHYFDAFTNGKKTYPYFR